MRLSDRLQGLCAQSWAKPGLGKKPYNTKKYGTIITSNLEQECTFFHNSISNPTTRGYL